MALNLSYRTWLLLSFWLLMAGVVLLPMTHYRQSLTREILAEAQVNAVRQLRLVAVMLQEARGIEEISDLQRLIERVGSELDLRITYIGETGRVLADSEVPWSQVPRMDSHAARPEVMEAGPGAVGMSIRYSGTVGKELIYVAMPVPATAHLPPGLLRVALPYSKVKARLDRVSRIISIALGVVFAASGILSLWLGRRLKVALGSLTNGVRTIGDGAYGHRVITELPRDLQPLAAAINSIASMMATDLQTVTDQLRRLEAILNGMQEAVMVIDGHCRIRAVNRAFADLVAGATEIIGRRPLEVMLNIELQQVCERVLADPNPVGDRFVHLELHQGVDGRVYDVTLVHLPDLEGKPAAIVVFHDISKLKRLEQLRQDFVANVSHELRTPLTSIKGYAEILLADEVPEPEQARSFLQVILKNADHLVTMVNDLLQLARLEAEESTARAVVAADVREALLAAWKSCAPLAQSKQIWLDNRLPEDGLLVRMDFEHLVQILRNLVENAIRYSPANETVSAECRLEDENAILTVTDRGPGVPQKDQRRIFERFYRVERHRRSHSGGTGLGLAICRHILLKYRGTIRVESPPAGQPNGAAFHVIVPRAELTRPDDAGAESA